MAIVKDYIEQNKARRAPTERQIRIKGTLKNPLTHFVIFGVVLIIFQLLCQTDLLKSSYVVTVGRTMIYAMSALGFCLLLGYSGLASLGTAGFMGLAAYFTGTFLESAGLPLTVSLLLTAAALTLVGVVIGFISLRIKGIFLAIITLGLSEILVALFIALDSWTGGQSGMRISMPQFFGKGLGFGIFANTNTAYMVLTLGLVLLMVATTNLINSPTGRAMLAMKNSSSASQAFGISILKYRLTAFIISTLYCAVAGFMYMIFIRASYPGTWNLSLSLNILGVIVIGGMKSVWGAVGGAFIFYGLDSLVLQNIPFFEKNPTFVTLVIGVLMIVIVMFYPGGLQQIVYEVRGGIKKLKAKYRRRKYGDE